jgi:choline kinase
MKAIILAAGVASRLRPLTDNTPKCLLNVGSKTILERTIENIIDVPEISELIIVTGYLNKMIEDFVTSKFPNLKVKFLHNSSFESTNNIFSLWLAKEELEHTDFILLDSDIVFEGEIIRLLIESGYDSCLALKTGLELGDEEIKVKVRNDNSIIEISKEVPPEDAVGESVGIEKFSAGFSERLFKVLDQMIIEERQENVFYEAAFQRVIDSGEKIFAVPVGNNYCMEIDFAEDLKEAEKLVS